ncbi:MAG: endonuclease III [Clostridiales bacterium]|nr:endonuclease III [Clostridiales bacterium]
MDEKCSFIYNTLQEIYKVPKCELNYENNFQLLVAVILSAQCTDKRVNIVTKELFKKYKTPQDFLKLRQIELEKLIYSCGFYKNKAKNILAMCYDLVEKYNGVVPNKLEDLITLSGVGRKTANVVLSEGFKQNAIAVDTHVFRVSHRLNLSKSKTPDKTEEDLKKIFDENLWSVLHLYLVLFGRYICKSQKPSCDICKFNNICEFYKGRNN